MNHCFLEKYMRNMISTLHVWVGLKTFFWFNKYISLMMDSEDLFGAV